MILLVDTQQVVVSWLQTGLQPNSDQNLKLLITHQLRQKIIEILSIRYMKKQRWCKLKPALPLDFHKVGKVHNFELKKDKEKEYFTICLRESGKDCYNLCSLVARELMTHWHQKEKKPDIILIQTKSSSNLFWAARL